MGSLGVDGGGNIYVVENWLGRLAKFDANGAPLATWNIPTSYGITVDTHGHVYITDYAAQRVLKQSSNGLPLSNWGTPGVGNGQFASPFGVAANTDAEVYVVDLDNNRIQKFGELPVPVQRVTWSELKGGLR